MDEKRKQGRPKKALVAPPVHRAILEPIEAKDVTIFNVRHGWVTIKRGNRTLGQKPEAENARNKKEEVKNA